MLRQRLYKAYTLTTKHIIWEFLFYIDNLVLVLSTLTLLLDKIINLSEGSIAETITDIIILVIAKIP